MTPPDPKVTNPPVPLDADEQMAKYGITRVSVEYFHYKEYRYTSLDHAIAEAKRQHAAVRSDRREPSASD